MPVQRIEDRFRDLSRDGRGALIPFLTCGYPDLEVTAELIRRADALGVAAVELGFPFSDSIADGPVIQDSYHFVLQQGQTVEDVFRLVSRVRPSVACGLIAMVSYTIVHRKGTGAFMEHAAGAGFDGVLLPDVPVEESAFPVAAAHRAGLGTIGLVAPTETTERQRAIARASSGFLYQIAVAGTTGERHTLPAGLPEAVARLRAVSPLPVCVGFGITTPEHVRAVCSVADGAIVGSAIVRRIREAVERGRPAAAVIESVAELLSALVAGAHRRDA